MQTQTQKNIRLLKQHDVTQHEVAKQIGVSHGHLRNVMAGNRTLSTSAQMLLSAMVDRFCRSKP